LIAAQHHCQNQPPNRLLRRPAEELRHVHDRRRLDLDCMTPLSGARAASGSLSPDSCCAGRVAMMAELGQVQTCPSGHACRLVMKFIRPAPRRVLWRAGDVKASRSRVLLFSHLPGEQHRNGANCCRND
jgi:hypothetical protein